MFDRQSYAGMHCCEDFPYIVRGTAELDELGCVALYSTEGIVQLSEQFQKKRFVS